MGRGIYIMANDKVIEQAIALLNSIRLRDPDTPVVMIPYNEAYQAAATTLTQRFGVTVFDDLDFIQRLSVRLQQIFGDRFFARPNTFRKYACWFGPFDEFLYIDTDAVVFEKIIDTLDYFSDYDFICCDYQHKGGIADVFTSKVREAKLFTESELNDVFNSGFWASKKGLISEVELDATFQECAAHPDWFDFSQKTSDQPILNYVILKHIPRRLNLVRIPDKAAGSWGGSPQFIRQGDRLFDPNTQQFLQYLHWAGIKIRPGCPYWDIWEHYRYLNEPKPESYPEDEAHRSLWQRLRAAVRELKRRVR